MALIQTHAPYPDKHFVTYDQHWGQTMRYQLLYELNLPHDPDCIDVRNIECVRLTTLNAETRQAIIRNGGLFLGLSAAIQIALILNSEPRLSEMWKTQTRGSVRFDGSILTFISGERWRRDYEPQVLTAPTNARFVPVIRQRYYSYDQLYPTHEFWTCDTVDRMHVSKELYSAVYWRQ